MDSLPLVSEKPCDNDDRRSAAAVRRADRDHRATLSVVIDPLILDESDGHSHPLHRCDDLALAVVVAIHMDRRDQEIRGLPDLNPMQMRFGFFQKRRTLAAE